MRLRIPRLSPERYRQVTLIAAVLLGVIIDVPHILEQIIECVKPFDVNIITVVTFDAGDAVGRRIMMKIEPTSHTESIRQSLEKKGFRVLDVKEVQPDANGEGS